MNSLAGLRIALVGPVPPPAGGMAMQTRQLQELLQQERARVELVPTNAPYRPAWAGRVRGVRALCRLLPYLRALWRALGRADVVHVMANSGWSWHLCAAPAIRLAGLRGVPVVVNYRGGQAEEFLHRASRRVLASMRGVARLVVPSGFLQQVFAQRGIEAEIVPNVVDLARFRPADGAPAGRAEPELFVSRNLEPIYDNATAIRALALLRGHHPAARLTLAGSGPQEAELRRLAQELGLAAQVEFTGRLERDAMAERLRRASVALNPSLVDNMPNSVLEALASGVPVVSTDVGGVPYIVTDGVTASLVPPSDPQAMATAIEALLDDPAAARQQAERGLQAVQAYTWARVGPRWAAVYDRARRPPQPV